MKKGKRELKARRAEKARAKRREVRSTMARNIRRNKRQEFPKLPENFDPLCTCGGCLEA